METDPNQGQDTVGAKTQKWEPLWARYLIVDKASGLTPLYLSSRNIFHDMKIIIMMSEL